MPFWFVGPYSIKCSDSQTLVGLQLMTLDQEPKSLTTRSPVTPKIFALHYARTTQVLVRVIIGKNYY